MKTKSYLILICIISQLNVIAQHESQQARIANDSTIREIISSEYKLLTYRIAYVHKRIEVYKNGELLDEINLDNYTDGSVFDQYKIGYFNKGNTKFYFGNIVSVYEYDLMNKKVKKLLPLSTDPPKTTYRILNILPNNNTMLLLKGKLLKRSELLEYEVIQRKDNNGKPVNKFSTRFIHVYLNLETENVDEAAFYNGYYESQYEDRRINFIKDHDN